MKNIYLAVILLISLTSLAQSVHLTHNVGTNLVETSMFTCPGGNQYWARTFILEDFGISTNEEYIINYGHVGFSEVSTWDANIGFHIYEIDENFPASFSEDNLIGSSPIIRIYSSDLNVLLAFDDPVVIPRHVERILVVVKQEFSLSSALTWIAGTVEDNDYSWYKGCGRPEYITTEDLGRPDARYYIGVTGVKTLSTYEVENKLFNIYPNPVQDLLVVHNATNTVINSIKIYDVLGRLVMEEKENVDQLDVSLLHSGLLIVKIETDTAVITKKVIKV